MASVVHLLHRRGLANGLSVVAVVTAVTVTAGAATTLEYTFQAIPSTGVAKRRAQAATSLATLTAGDVPARWLRDRTSPDTVLITNRHCVVGMVSPGLGPEPTRCDVMSFWISAWNPNVGSSLRGGRWDSAVELEKINGLTYKRQPFWDQAKLKANDGFFDSPSRAEAEALCSYGATYAVLDRRAPTLASQTRRSGQDLHQRDRRDLSTSMLKRVCPLLLGQAARARRSLGSVRAAREQLPGSLTGPDGLLINMFIKSWCSETELNEEMTEHIGHWKNFAHPRTGTPTNVQQRTQGEDGAGPRPPGTSISTCPAPTRGRSSRRS